MDARLAQMIVDLAGDPDLQVREEYSGRFMYGKSTTAIVDHRDGGPDLLSIVLRAVADGDLTAEDLGGDMVIGNIRSDSMGLGMVYY